MVGYTNSSYTGNIQDKKLIIKYLLLFFCYGDCHLYNNMVT